MRGEKYFLDAESAVDGNGYIGDTIPKRCVLDWLDKYDGSTGKAVCPWTVEEALKLIAGISPAETSSWEHAYSWCDSGDSAGDEEKVAKRLGAIVDAFEDALSGSERTELRKPSCSFYCLFGE